MYPKIQAFDSSHSGRLGCIAIVGLALVASLLTLGLGLFSYGLFDFKLPTSLNPTILPCSTYHYDNMHASGKLLSNGTHEFRKTVLLVSIDGTRCVLLT